MGRLGSAEEVANMVVYLASDEVSREGGRRMGRCMLEVLNMVLLLGRMMYMTSDGGGGGGGGGGGAVASQYNYLCNYFPDSLPL